MPDPTLHPNLAKIAAAYDNVIERSARKQISPTQARAEIAQLEARDDDGVRWSIDPDSGQWIRKTAFGDAEFDGAPPTYGYRTFDAFDLGNPHAAAFNPADRLTFQAVLDTAPYPGALGGATRRTPDTRRPSPSLLARRAGSPRVVAAVATALAALVLGLAWVGLHQDSAPPAPAVTTPAASPAPAG